MLPLSRMYNKNAVFRAAFSAIQKRQLSQDFFFRQVSPPYGDFFLAFL